jgi:hypothetical protein
MNTPLDALTDTEAGKNAFAVVFSLGISFVLFATAIVPASPTMFS